LGYISDFLNIAQSKQSPNRRKFAQSGHPDSEWPDRASVNFGLQKMCRANSTISADFK
jgi:hypothetical protein